ncbi:PD-(D/E)XK motif protein [Algibacter sp. L1A34]|uniref:PD-(D/E)XK motif protein n=1 Tax=Algibacter sp. L1A34 TaxID=2686365 RepID=UPI00131E3E7B|nr:PD-(D/E)XK motif protein [Algibacter sp. L1A34]
MVDLKEIYDVLPLPTNQNSNSYSAKAIKGFKNHRIAKNYANNPSLLIFISEQNQDFLIANQNLFSIKISHNLKCEIESDKKSTCNNFSVVSYIGQNDEIKNIFLSTCQVLIKSLGQNPSNKKIKTIVSKFIELFKSIKEPPRKSIQGLWAELLLIEQSNSPINLINAWHCVPEEKFDFSFDQLRIEVKSSGSDTRTHHFTIGQLKSINNTEIFIASILMKTNTGGLSISDLLNNINNKLTDFQKQKEKLHLLVYATLGMDIDKVSLVKFDYELAKGSLQFYNSKEIPKIESELIPKEVSNVKFTSNLINSKFSNFQIDELIKPFI